MTLAPPIVVTVAVIVVASLMTSSFKFPIMLLIVPITALWATVDASRLRQRYAAEPSFMPTKDDAAILQTSKPIIVFTVCFMAWFFGFPWYLVMRHKLLSGAPVLAKGSDNAAA